MKISNYESFGKALVCLRDMKRYTDEQRREAYSAIMFYMNEVLEARWQSENARWELDKRVKELEREQKAAAALGQRVDGGAE